MLRPASFAASKTPLCSLTRSEFSQSRYREQDIDTLQGLNHLWSINATICSFRRRVNFALWALLDGLKRFLFINKISHIGT